MKDRVNSEADPEKVSIDNIHFSDTSINNLPSFPVETPVQGASPLGIEGSPSLRGPGAEPPSSCQHETEPSRLIKTNYGNDVKFAVSRFKEYLKKRESWYIKIHGKVKLTGTHFTYKKEDIHRWKDGYLRKRLARLYKLRVWFDGQPSKDVTMITLTVPHNENKWGRKVRDGADMYQAWKNLKRGWTRIYQSRPGLFRNKSFVIFYEPHPASGYPHIHMMMFGTMTGDEIERLKSTWSQLTGADPLNGVDVRPGVGVKHLIAYLVKYMSKTLYHTIDEWTPGEWAFNAIAHEERYRLFGSSNDLAEVMRLDTESDGTIECLDVSLEGLKPRFDDDETNTSRVWTNPDLHENSPMLSDKQPVSTADQVQRWKEKNHIPDSEAERVFRAKHKAWIKRGGVDTWRDDKIAAYEAMT
jgi:hypothetical protein